MAHLAKETRDAIVAAYGRESARTVGERYGLSRNAVIGLWHRHVPAELRGTAPRSHAEPRRAPRAARAAAARPEPRSLSEPAAAARIVDRRGSAPVALPPLPVPADEPAPEGGVGIAGLELRHCRYSVGTGPDGRLRFCGASRLRRPGVFSDGCSPYCAEHTRLSYAPAPVREKRKDGPRPQHVAWGWG
ncbi:Uncharacterized protein Ga0061061_111108 [Chelatococcus sambhunathii]|uniref:GcrA cell cycle regulator n=1 Tax=Chelatococcus sambhunathii TaxID=363953 RepID=A0ABM9U8I1_9HYPH|nr:GcrA family cell cycle regulator [Chelatococcus sambhunathii]CUA90193.1 Uncharacterized protein Ga0061061_111108 [Chelatococcus sambhunathii]